MRSFYEYNFRIIQLFHHVYCFLSNYPIEYLIKTILALSRLWFSDAQIIILDEAASAMDNITEKIVMDRVIDKLKNKTVIMISHRLNIVQDFDEIVLLQKILKSFSCFSNPEYAANALRPSFPCPAV